VFDDNGGGDGMWFCFIVVVGSSCNFLPLLEDLKPNHFSYLVMLL